MGRMQFVYLCIGHGLLPTWEVDEAVGNVFLVVVGSRERMH